MSDYREENNRYKKGKRGGFDIAPSPHKRKKKKNLILESRYTGEEKFWRGGWREWHTAGRYEKPKDAEAALKHYREEVKRFWNISGTLFYPKKDWEYRIKMPA